MSTQVTKAHHFGSILIAQSPAKSIKYHGSLILWHLPSQNVSFLMVQYQSPLGGFSAKPIIKAQLPYLVYFSLVEKLYKQHAKSLHKKLTLNLRKLHRSLRKSVLNLRSRKQSRIKIGWSVASWDVLEDNRDIICCVLRHPEVLVKLIADLSG